MDSFVVFGANGHLGRHLAPAIKEKFDCEVYTVDVTNSVLGKDFHHFVGSILDLNFLRQVATELRLGNVHLRGIVNCAAGKEFITPQVYETEIFDKEFESLSRDEKVLEAFCQFPQEFFLEALNVNLIGVHNTLVSLMPLILNSTECSIVNLGSQYGIKTPDQSLFHRADKFVYKPPAYSTSKASLVAYTEYVASIIAMTNARINLFTPGSLYRGQTSRFQADYVKRTFRSQMLSVHEAVKPILFLLSPDSKYMNGLNLIFDGGWTRR